MPDPLTTYLENTMEKEVIKFTAQLDRVTSTKDGGSKITFTCGYESIEAIQKIVRLNAIGDTSMAIAIVSYDN